MSTLFSRVAARVITPLAVALGVFLWLRGHFALGGGFLAGGAIGVAVVFRHVTIGADAIERLLDRGVGHVVGAGLLVMIAYGFAGYLWGKGFMASATLHVEVPLVGDVAIPSTLLFELGVSVVVIGAAVAVIHELGDHEE